MKNTIYIFAWGNNSKRAKLKGRACKILNDEVLNDSPAAVQAGVLILTRSCEVVFVDTGQHEIVSRRALRAIKCRDCRQPLIEIDFNTAYCIRLCDNFHCRLYDQPQGLRSRSEEEGKIFGQRRQSRTAMRFTDGKAKYKEVTPDRHEANARAKARPGYRPWLERKKANYHKLRALGYSCRDAIDNTSKKRMIELGVEVN